MRPRKEKNNEQERGRGKTHPILSNRKNDLSNSR